MIHDLQSISCIYTLPIVCVGTRVSSAGDYTSGQAVPGGHKTISSTNAKDNQHQRGGDSLVGVVSNHSNLY